MSDSTAFEFVAESRQETGKAATRRLRREGKVPATVYGAGKKPESLTLLQNEVVKTLGNEAVFSHILDLKVAGKSQKVVLKALERHVTKPLIMHIDFLRVKATESIIMQVPLHFMGEEDSPGVKEGGVISHLMTAIEVKCLPANLPEAINIDVSGLGMNSSIHLSEIKLPSGVEFAGVELDEAHDVPVVSIHAARVEEEPAAEAEATADETAKASAADEETAAESEKEADKGKTEG